MQKFSYTRTSDGVTVEAHGSLFDIAAEVGYMVRNIYGTLMKQHPAEANAFKKMVLVVIAAPDSPTWDASMVNPDVGIVISAPPKNDRRAGVVAGAQYGFVAQLVEQSVSQRMSSVQFRPEPPRRIPWQ